MENPEEVRDFYEECSSILRVEIQITLGGI